MDDGLALDLGQPVQDSGCNFKAPSTWLSIRVVEVPKSYKGPSIVPLSGHRDYPAAIFAVPCPRSEPKAYNPALRELHSYIASTGQPQKGVVLGVATTDELNAALASIDDDKGSDHALWRLATELNSVNLSDARKVVMPIAVSLLCQEEEIDKEILSSCLHRLVSRWPNGNPPRAALKRINEFYMSERT